MQNMSLPILSFVLLAVLALALLSLLSHRQTYSGGLEDGRLASCERETNCRCSEYRDHPSFVEPLHFEKASAQAWQEAAEAVEALGGTIVRREATYLHATFTSLLFRFVDDFELRLDAEKKHIHIRSSSRVGYSDLGANSRRVAQFMERAGH
jgi:uncharacterized protein (DUF1499 family)